ncbi:MAG: peptide chain release factor N(5)-glutamine methyltransferase [Muribaculaceae bacterium]|nr:peptide chain release factor N(5)-glutamine methyltransferase [Muribaculaceae bacterium]
MSDNNSLTVAALKSSLTALLAAKYGTREANAMVRMMIEEVMGWSAVDIALRSDYVLNEATAGRLQAIAGRVYDGEPIQYVLGVASFHGLRFKVTPATLIPRPETSELVDIIADEAAGRKDLRILDCGTGSGCIAIALARALPFSRVTGIDISDDALAVARDNASALKADVSFRNADILALNDADTPLYDIIVSNPPYIAEHEREGMEANVLDYEPHSALFVPDDDPLRFYTAIGSYGLSALAPGGRLYFEINPLYADRLRKDIGGMGYRDVEIMRDMYGRKRFLTARL